MFRCPKVRLNIVRRAICGPTREQHSYLNFQESIKVAPVQNEIIRQFEAGTDEASRLQKSILKWQKLTTDIPIVIGDEEFRTDEIREQRAPYDHGKIVSRYYYADEALINKAIKNSLSVREDWEKRSYADRINIFQKAADLVSGKYRYDLIATTMIGQAKTVVQAEIDCAAELADFLRYNAFYCSDLLNYKPANFDEKTSMNQYRYRGFEGFFTAISPFNFTAIGGNLASAPVLMGNVVLWKPADSAMMSNYLVFQILREAGIPPGVINFIPAQGPLFGKLTTGNAAFSGINFTGSLATFRNIWKEVSNNLVEYNDFPRILGECGGKNFHFVHESADVDRVVDSTVRSAFEYSGQKCSACERLYVPRSMWPTVGKGLVETLGKLKLGSPFDPDVFSSAVIDQPAFEKIASYIDHGKRNHELVCGGKTDSSKGWFIEPTIFLLNDKNDRLMTEEIFGPVLSVYLYEPDEVQQAMCDALTGSKYGLTAAIFARDSRWLREASEFFKHAGGNFYINDKSTGAVVGQQPFGGSRLSGTNDKPGGPHYLLRFTSPQSIKQSKL